MCCEKREGAHVQKVLSRLLECLLRTVLTLPDLGVKCQVGRS